MIDQRRFFFDWELSLQGPYHKLKHLGISIEGSIISGKVDIHASAGQLRVDLPEGCLTTRCIRRDTCVPPFSHVLCVNSCIAR